MLSVILPTRNPHPERLRRTLAALAAQSLPVANWELIIVDNASDRPWALPPGTPSQARIVREETSGLTPARLRGVRESTGETIVFVDDDNVLQPEYLAVVERMFAAEPQLGAAGGPVRPEWEAFPPDWALEFSGRLALRDFGATFLRCTGGAGIAWPTFAPVGAGMCVRRAAFQIYAGAVEADPRRMELDRKKGSLASGGDNDIVFTMLHAGWDVAYSPALHLTHLIPAARLDPDYLARLNQGVMRTWVRVLHLHGQCPWPAISPATVPLRAFRTWLRLRAWRRPAARIRWHATLGQFQGQADLSPATLRP